MRDRFDAAAAVLIPNHDGSLAAARTTGPDSGLSDEMAGVRKSIIV